MKSLNYVKPSSSEKLFKKFDKNGLTMMQNYNPIYDRFFSLSEQNWNRIRLNHRHHLADFARMVGDDGTHCVLMDATLDEIGVGGKKGGKKGGGRCESGLKKNVFVKVSPLLNPFHYLSGAFPIDKLDVITRLIPTFSSSSSDSSLSVFETKVSDINNAAYTDAFFTFLSNQLADSFHFVNGLRFYGSFVGVKQNFMYNVADDLDHLLDTEFFVSQKDKLFTVEDYSEFFEETAVAMNAPPLPRLTVISGGEGEGGDDDVMLDICEECEVKDDSKPRNDAVNTVDDAINAVDAVDMVDVIDGVDAVDAVDDAVVKLTRMRSSSSCSSCSSCSSHSSACEADVVNEGELTFNNTKARNEDTNDDDDGSSCDEDLPDIYATIPQFPVQLICMEECRETLDDYLDRKGFARVSETEWFSILMQIIMTLLVYQKTFHFTHNDLHTNNVMYVETNKKYVFYRYGGALYRVPTYGRLYKIIDFGRAIFDYRGVRFCSDHFQPNGDAYSQYNTEPYYEADRPRIDPNYSFDLCRLACTLFDELHQDDSGEDNGDQRIDMRQMMEKIHRHSRVAKLIAEWCTGDDGKNVLYKNNGDERYPDFKLYKMIARRVHRHTPEAQLVRPEFAAFRCGAGFIVPKGMPLVDIDAMGDYTGGGGV